MALYRPIYLFLFVVCSGALIVAGLPSNLTMGKALFESFQYDESLRYLTKAEGSDHSNLEALKKLKQYYLLQGDLTAPIEIQERLVTLRPKNLHFREDLETLYSWSNKTYKRLIAMRNRAELLPLRQREVLLLEVAEGLRWMGRTEEAEAIYQRLLDSQNSEVLNPTLNFFLGHGQVRKARKALERLLPQENFDNEKRGYYAESLELEGEWEKAIVQYIRIVAGVDRPWEEFLQSLKTQKISPKERAYLEHIQLIFFNQHEYGRMDQLYQVLRGRYPENIEYLFSHVEVLLALKEFARVYADLPRLEKARVHRHSVARFYYDLGYKQDALRVFERLIQDYPNDLALAKELAQLYEELGEKRKALEIWYKVLKRAPQSSIPVQWGALYAQNSPINDVSFKKKVPLKRVNSEEAAANISRLHEELGENDKALEKVLELLNGNPNNPEARKRAMRLFMQKGEFDKAYNLIPGTDPDREVHALSAEIYFHRQEFLKVVESIDAIPFEERESYLFIMQEEALFKSHQDERYQNFCRRLEMQRSEVPVFYLVLAHCYTRQKDFKSAREYYLKILSATPADSQLVLRQEFFYFLLENTALAEAKAQLRLLENAEAKEQLRRDYITRYQETRLERGLFLSLEGQWQEVVDGELFKEKFAVSRGLGHGKKLGAQLERGHSGNQSADLTHVYLFYERNFFLSTHEFETKFKVGDDLHFKKEGTPLSLSLSPILSGKRYLSASAWATRPEAFSKAQWQAPRAYSNGVSLYAEMENNWALLVCDQRFTGEWQHLDYAGETGKQTKADLNLLFHLYEWPSSAWVSFGPGLAYAKMPSQSVFLRNIYVSDSLYYYASGEFHSNFGRKNLNALNGGARVGGDSRRDLEFADSWGVWAEYLRPLGVGQAVRARIEYSTEGPQNYKGKQFSAIIALELMPNRETDL